MKKILSLRERGISLVEMLVVVGIIGVLATISITAFSSFLKREGLSSNSLALAGALRDARSRTLASVKGVQYGVKIDADRFTLFSGSIFSTSTAEAPYMFSPSVRASSPFATVLFSRITGDSSASGTMSLSLVGNPNSSVLVHIQGTGVVTLTQ